MELLLTFQDFAIAISFTLLTALAITPYRRDYKPYRKSKFCLMAGLALMLIQFGIQRFGMLRMYADYSIALCVNIALFMPTAYFFLNTSIILLTNDRVKQGFHVLSACLYVFTLLMSGCNIIVSHSFPDLVRAAQAACGVGFLTHLVLSYRYAAKAYLDVKHNLDNFYDYDAEQIIAFMKHSCIVTMAVGLLAPFVIITNNHFLVCAFIGAFCLTIIYFVTRFIGYEKEQKKVIMATESAVEEDFSDAVPVLASADGTDIHVSSPAPDSPTLSSSADAGTASDDFSLPLANWVKRKRHLQKNLTILLLANDLDTNQKYLSRYFSEVLHTTFREWLNETRMQDAKEMLLDDRNFTVEHIAQECGFGSRTHFHSIFVKKCGMTPSQFRSENSFHYQD